MRLGGPIFQRDGSPADYIARAQALGYGAINVPNSDFDHQKAVTDEARRRGLVVAEVGAWSNPLSSNPDERAKAVALCKERLALADTLGARCCVNISGSRGKQWDGPDALNLTDETFDMIVTMVRQIIDDVQPSRTFYTLETMPWMYPDSIESYLRLLNAIDRPQFAVHFDPVNLICSPQRYYLNARLIEDFVATLGGHIRSCHAKDIRLGGRLTTHLDECAPGTGNLDYPTFLKAVHRLDPDMPVMMEHLPDQAAYEEAGQFIRRTALEHQLELR